MKRVRTAAVGATAAVVAAAFLTAGALAGHGSGDSTVAAARATAPFHSLAAAKRAGYGLLKDRNGIACIAMAPMAGMGAMGVHYAKPSLIPDGALSVSSPEALVYAPEHGRLRLAAIEYVALKAAWDANHATQPRLFGHPFNLTPAGNRFGLPAFYSLHVWIWKHNPAGTFTMWNPEVTCP